MYILGFKVFGVKYSFCLYVYLFGRLLRICVSGPMLGCISTPKSINVHGACYDFGDFWRLWCGRLVRFIYLMFVMRVVDWRLKVWV